MIEKVRSTLMLVKHNLKISQELLLSYFKMINININLSFTYQILTIFINIKQHI